MEFRRVLFRSVVWLGRIDGRARTIHSYELLTSARDHFTRSGSRGLRDSRMPDRGHRIAQTQNYNTTGKKRGDIFFAPPRWQPVKSPQNHENREENLHSSKCRSEALNSHHERETVKTPRAPERKSVEQGKRVSVR